MTDGEIVRELRRLAENSRSKHDVLVAAADLIESLQAQLSKSQRREQAAVEDWKIYENSGQCDVCKYGECGGCTYPEGGRCHFEWRGPQEAGKGEAE